MEYLPTIKTIFSEKKYIWASALIAIVAFLSPIMFIYTHVSFSLELAAFQHTLAPFIIALLFLINREYLNFSQRIRVAAEVGFLTGTFSATISLIVENIVYWFGGGREMAAAALGLPITPFDINLIYDSLIFNLIVWVIMVCFSVASGALSAIFPVGKSQDHINIQQKNDSP